MSAPMSYFGAYSPKLAHDLGSRRNKATGASTKTHTPEGWLLTTRPFGMVGAFPGWVPSSRLSWNTSSTGDCTTWGSPSDSL